MCSKHSPEKSTSPGFRGRDESWQILGQLIDDEATRALQGMFLVCSYAKSKQIEPQQFALTLHEITSLGVKPLLLRVLVADGLLIHLCEKSDGHPSRRIFETTCKLSFHECSCFVPNCNADSWNSICADKRISISENDPLSTEPSPCMAIPVWNAELRRLEFRGRMVKHFRCPAHNQETILSAFQEDGWPERIADPLPPLGETDPKQRLHDAIRGLNRNQALQVLHFGGDGTGEGIVWFPKLLHSPS